MAMSTEPNVAAAARQFQISGEYKSAETYGTGHINDTYRAVFQQQGAPVSFILQRINTSIFKNPVALMENVQRVTAHLAAQVKDLPDRDRRVLSLIPTRDGRGWYVDAEGDHWRVYHFINGARSYEAVETTAQAFQAAKAFGEFQKLLASLPAPRLSDLPPWSSRSLPTLPAARPSQNRRLNSRWRTNPSPAFCWMQTCLSALPTTTPS
jgi:hypothetical protein